MPNPEPYPHDLPEGERRVFDDLLDYNPWSLADYLFAGNTPSPRLCSLLAHMIEYRELVAQSPPPPSQATLNRQARAERDLRIGAWVWVRRLHVKGATQEAIEAEAAGPDGLGVSKPVVHRAYLSFKARMESDDAYDRSQGRGALMTALRELCEQHGFDFYEQHARLYSVQNLDLEIEPRKLSRGE